MSPEGRGPRAHPVQMGKLVVTAVMASVRAARVSVGQMVDLVGAVVTEKMVVMESPMAAVVEAVTAVIGLPVIMAETGVQVRRADQATSDKVPANRSSSMTDGSSVKGKQVAVGKPAPQVVAAVAVVVLQSSVAAVAMAVAVAVLDAAVMVVLAGAMVVAASGLLSFAARV